MNEMMSQFVEMFLLALVPPLAGMLAAWLLSMVRKAWADVRDRAGDWGWALEEGARMAVRAAEQMQLAEMIADKKQYALATVDEYLRARGFTIDIAIIEAAVEAAVLREFNQK